MVQENGLSVNQAEQCSRHLRLGQPHFKKDSRFVTDLYTLTYVPESTENLGKLNYLDLQRGGAGAQGKRENFLNSVSELDEYAEDDELIRDSSLLMRKSNRSRTNDMEQFQSLPVTINIREPALTLVQHQMQLQEEARLALAQAGRMARWQMELERQNRTELVVQVVKQQLQQQQQPNTQSLESVGPVNAESLLQLSTKQVASVIESLHQHISDLNARLVSLLEERDELIQEQDNRLNAAEQAAITSFHRSPSNDCNVQPMVQLLETARRKSATEVTHCRRQKQRSSLRRLWRAK